ncbi:unnamed protein product [Spirodela intermedia]|uniref:Uncharacterized protein n=1 Tax=Spirodela intermedia TaxID=51605 RepID=A0A7I8JB28_SPIIN|nr:unnamed protein product [Spirodela intermedia]CAA6666682.1 unnamed protein product [Spirodela intermedia]
MGRISLMGKGHGSPSSKRPAAAAELRRGHFAVYVGTEENPSFQALLHQAEEVFGLDQPPGGLRLPCSEPTFLSVVSQLGGS